MESNCKGRLLGIFAEHRPRPQRPLIGPRLAGEVNWSRAVTQRGQLVQFRGATVRRNGSRKPTDSQSSQSPCKFTHILASGINRKTRECERKAPQLTFLRFTQRTGVHVNKVRFYSAARSLHKKHHENICSHQARTRDCVCVCCRSSHTYTLTHTRTQQVEFFRKPRAPTSGKSAPETAEEKDLGLSYF